MQKLIVTTVLVISVFSASLPPCLAEGFSEFTAPRALPETFKPAYDEASKHIVERTYEAAQDLRPLAEFFDEDNKKYLDFITFQAVARLHIQSARKVYRIIFLILYETIQSEDVVHVKPCFEEHARALREYHRRQNDLKNLKDSADQFMGMPLVDDDIPSAAHDASKRTLSDYYACIADLARMSAELRAQELQYLGLMTRRDGMISAAKECLLRIEHSSANDVIVVDDIIAQIPTI